MDDPQIQDLQALDADVARAVLALERWRALALSDAQAAADVNPFEGDLRRVAAKSTRDAVRELPVGIADEPLRRGLVRWIAVLTGARVALVDDLARARAASAATIRFEGELPRWASWREGWRELLAARSAAEARRWLEALAAGGDAMATVQRAAGARRLEIARRLGFAHPWDADDRGGAGVRAGAHRAAVLAAARTLLAATEDLARVQIRTVAGDGGGAASVLHAALAKEASDGWPARLTARWFDELFSAGTRGLDIRLPALPRALGGASFARALVAFGHAVPPATAPRGVPFVVAHDPWQAASHRLGAVFGALATDVEFHARALGLGRRRAAAQARVLAASALLEVRVQAARVLLGDDERLSPADLFDEVTTRLFGATLDARLRGAWPLPRADEPERLVAVLVARSAREKLRNRFDVDWFRNPRAWDYLREPSDAIAPDAFTTSGTGLTLEGAAAKTAPEWDDEAVALARAFEGALG